MNHERLMKYVPELNATLSNDPNVQATTPFKMVVSVPILRDPHERYSNVSLLYIMCIDEKSLTSINLHNLRQHQPHLVPVQSWSLQL